MFGQAIGPVFGGALTQYLGFRSIFYFLLGLASFVVALLFLYLPETLRKIAGNGSKPLFGIYNPVFGRVKSENDIPKEQRYKPTPLSFSTLFESFKLLAEKDVFVSLLFGGIIYTVWSMITSSTSTLFKEEYHLSDVLIGLCFLPNGKKSLLYPLFKYIR
jgi:MFS family permease